jgi:hypothetical protein
VSNPTPLRRQKLPHIWAWIHTLFRRCGAVRSIPAGLHISQWSRPLRSYGSSHAPLTTCAATVSARSTASTAAAFSIISGTLFPGPRRLDVCQRPKEHLESRSCRGRHRSGCHGDTHTAMRAVGLEYDGQLADRALRHHVRPAKTWRLVVDPAAATNGNPSGYLGHTGPL